MIVKKHPHYHYHIHRASVEMIEKGLNPEKQADITTDFNSYESALAFFLREANIDWKEEHFPNLVQPGLPGLLPGDDTHGN